MNAFIIIVFAAANSEPSRAIERLHTDERLSRAVAAKCIMEAFINCIQLSKG